MSTSVARNATVIWHEVVRSWGGFVNLRLQLDHGGAKLAWLQYGKMPSFETGRKTLHAIEKFSHPVVCFSEAAKLYQQMVLIFDSIP